MKLKHPFILDNLWVVAGCTEGELQFESDIRPILQICSEGKWGYICAKNDYQWSINEAQVACQQMGKKSNNTGKVETFWC